MRIQFVFPVLLLAIFLSSCQNNKKSVKPNIIIILSDDQGWGDLSCNGNTNLSTPNIDKLAKAGVTFDRFYVCAVCSPTRAELLTGRYHVRSGVWSTGAGGERMDVDETTIAEIFKEAGYQTAAYGKWHNGMQPPYHPNNRGFDDFYGFCSGHWGNYFSPMLEHNGEIVQGNGFIIDDLTNHGIDFIEQNQTRPFFLYLPFNTPHSPMQAPAKFWKKYRDKPLKMFNRGRQKEDTLFTKAALAMCDNIDWNVGRITKKVEELGLDENTIILYFSDNGPNSWRWNDGMKGRKGSTDEGGVRSPLIMKWKNHFKEGEKITTISSVTDLLPTLSDLAEITPLTQHPLDGVSLKPLLTGKEYQHNDRIIFNYWNQKTSARNQKFRIDNNDRLFDMENDPGQTTNVAEKFPDEYAKLYKAKHDWIENVVSELNRDAKRPFTVGYSKSIYTQLPARDGIAHGNIIRSNRWPNSSYYLNWISTNDSITWPVDVLENGEFEVELFYTCPVNDVGSRVRLSCNNQILDYKISEAFDPPLLDKSDIYPRGEGYVKPFKKVNMGRIQLKKGKGTLCLKALEIPGSQVMDFRLLMLKRI